MDCLFCEIINGNIPSSKVYENEYVYAFYDINPNALVHVVVVPKLHIDSLDEVNDNNISAVSEVMRSIPLIAAKCDLANGYRVITNIGEDGRQSIKHLHFHILGGQKLADKLN